MNRSRRKKQNMFRAVTAVLAAALFAVGTMVQPVRAENFSEADYQILGNIVGGVESGGQVYGQKDYSAYAGAHANSANEVTCTLGWPQYYGNEAQRLVQKIYDKDPASFRKIDSQGLIQAKLKVNWVNTQWNPNAAEKNVLIQLISSSAGKAAQDEMFTEVVRPMVEDCEKTYTKDARAVALYVEIRHLGGKGPADRIFKRCNGNYSVDRIKASLKADQEDKSNNNQVGDELYWSRHEKCFDWVQTYIPDGNSGSNSNSNSGSNSNSNHSNSGTSASVRALYRMYNAHSGEHFYTQSTKERSYLQSVGWKYEGVAWDLPATSSTPVYRLYNPSAGDHFYTASSKEKNYLSEHGWKYEGIGWYSDSAKSVAVYREFNPNAKTGTHNFTTNKGEHSYLVSHGWKNEGVAWYGA